MGTFVAPLHAGRTSRDKAPQPYLGQLLRKAPIAVVDQDRSELSRSLVQTLDAYEATKVAVRADTLAVFE